MREHICKLSLLYINEVLIFVYKNSNYRISQLLLYFKQFKSHFSIENCGGMAKSHSACSITETKKTKKTKRYYSKTAHNSSAAGFITTANQLFQSFCNQHQYINVQKVLPLHSKRHAIILLGLKHVDLACIFQSLSTVTKPDPNHLSVVIQLLCDLCNLLASRKGVFLKVSVEDLDGLRREARSPFTLLGGFSAHKLHQVLLAFLIPELSLCQPALQHGFQLLGTFRSDVKLLKSSNKRQSVNTQDIGVECESFRHLYLTTDFILNVISKLYK